MILSSNSSIFLVNFDKFNFFKTNLNKFLKNFRTLLNSLSYFLTIYTNVILGMVFIIISLKKKKCGNTYKIKIKTESILIIL